MTLRTVYESLALDEYLNVTALAFGECDDADIWAARLNTFMGVQLPLPKKAITDPNPGGPRPMRLPWLCRMRALQAAGDVRAIYNASVCALLKAANCCSELVPVDRYQAPRTLLNDAVTYFTLPSATHEQQALVQRLSLLGDMYVGSVRRFMG